MVSAIRPDLEGGSKYFFTHVKTIQNIPSSCMYIQARARASLRDEVSASDAIAVVKLMVVPNC